MASRVLLWSVKRLWEKIEITREWSYMMASSCVALYPLSHLFTSDTQQVEKMKPLSPHTDSSCTHPYNSILTLSSPLPRTDVRRYNRENFARRGASNKSSTTAQQQQQQGRQFYQEQPFYQQTYSRFPDEEEEEEEADEGNRLYAFFFFSLFSLVVLVSVSFCRYPFRYRYHSPRGLCFMSFSCFPVVGNNGGPFGASRGWHSRFEDFFGRRR